jgi:riboflavin synthase alpha subunit
MGNKILSIDHVHCVAQLKKLEEATQNSEMWWYKGIEKDVVKVVVLRVSICL